MCPGLCVAPGAASDHGAKHRVDWRTLGISPEAQLGSFPDYVKRAEQLGARTIIPPQTLPEGEVLAIVQDPQGIPFGLMSGRSA